MSATSPHPIDPFLEAWEREVDRRAFDLRLRVYRALSRELVWTRVRLRATLRAILAFDREEQARFDVCFDGFFSEGGALPETVDTEALYGQLRRALDLPEEVIDGVTEAPVVEASTPAVGAPTTPKRSPDEAWSVGAAAVMLAGLVGLAVWSSSHAPKVRSGSGRGPQVVAPVAPPAPPERVPTTREEVRVTRAQATNPVALVLEPPSQQWLRALALGAAALGVVTLGEKRLRALSLREVPVPPTPPMDDTTWEQRVLDLRWPDPMPPPLTHAQCEDLAERLGFVHEGPLRAFDLPATVQATARAGGLLVPVERARRRSNVLRVVCPKALDPFAACVIDALLTGLRASGVEVERGDGGPEHGRGDLNLVFLDAAEPEGVPVERWVRSGHTSLVDLRDPRRWGPEVSDLPCGVFALTFEGIAAAIDAARINRVPAPTAPRGSGDARDRLGEAFPLAQAVALVAPIDLAGMDALRREHFPAVDFVAMQRVVALDGVSGGPPEWRVSKALRESLCASLTPEARTWRMALAWQRERLARIEVPEGSRAQAMLVLERDISEMLLEGTGAVPMGRLARLQGDPVMKRALKRRVEEAKGLRVLEEPATHEEAELAAAAGVIEARPRAAVGAMERGLRGVATAAAVVAAAGGLWGARVPPRGHVWLGAASDAVGVSSDDADRFRCSSNSTHDDLEGLPAMSSLVRSGSNDCGLGETRASVIGTPFITASEPQRGLAFVSLTIPQRGGCSAGSVVVGFHGLVTGPTAPKVVSLTAHCRRSLLDTTSRVEELALPGAAGNLRGARPFSLLCGPQGHVSEVEFAITNRAISGMRITCGCVTP